MPRWLLPGLLFAAALAGCGSTATAPQPPAEKKTAEPAIPEEVQQAAKAFLGSDVTVLVFGDLAKTGKQQFLAANVVPNTPKSVVAGTVVTRAVVAENEGSTWLELLRCDEHLKNSKGYLSQTPRQSINGWKLQYEDSPENGITLYFTPIKGDSVEKTLPIAVKWNPAVKRYQSMDLSYQNFLGEVISLENPRSTLR